MREARTNPFVGGPPPGEGAIVERPPPGAGRGIFVVQSSAVLLVALTLLGVTAVYYLFVLRRGRRR